MYSFTLCCLTAVFIPFASKSDGCPAINLYAFLIVPMNFGAPIECMWGQ